MTAAGGQQPERRGTEAANDPEPDPALATSGRRRFALLAATDEAFRRPLEEQAGLCRLVRAPLSCLADWCAVDLVEPDGSLRRAAVAHVDPAKEPLVEELRRCRPATIHTAGGVPEVIRGGRPALLPNIAEAPPEVQNRVLEWTGEDSEYLRLLRAVGLRSAMIAPLRRGEQVVGALTIVSVGADRRYGPDDLLLAQNLVARFAAATEQARLETERARLESEVKTAGAAVGQLEQELRLARQLGRRLFGGISDALLIIAEDGRYLDANPSASALLGYTREELMAMRVGDLPAIGPPWTEAERAHFVREGTWRGQMEIRRKDGTMIPVEVRATAVAAPNQTLYIAALRDITARVALERLERQVAALVAREVRILSPKLRGLANMLRGGRPHD